MNYKIFFGFILGWVLSGFMGYKFGDSRGYSDGFEVGYRYDCKDEISLIHSQINCFQIVFFEIGNHHIVVGGGSRRNFILVLSDCRQLLDFCVLFYQLDCLFLFI